MLHSPFLFPHTFFPTIRILIIFVLLKSKFSLSRIILWLQGAAVLLLHQYSQRHQRHPAERVNLFRPPPICAKEVPWISKLTANLSKKQQQSLKRYDLLELHKLRSLKIFKSNDLIE